MRVAVLGLGEAGGIYAADLVQRGATVVVTDPLAVDAPAGASLVSSVAEAVRGADVALSLVGARAAASVLEDAMPEMGDSSIFADMNTGSPDAKRRLAERCQGRGIPFVDVAILAPVPRARIATPLLMSGSGAAGLLPRFETLGIPATNVGAEAGVSASMKLLRSVFMKGLAAVVFESLSAADSAGVRDWVQQQIASELGPAGDGLVQRLMEGTAIHAVRREAEMRDALAFLESLGSPTWMTQSTIEWLHELAERREARHT